MRAKLSSRSGELAGLEFEIGHEEATVGRAATNTIVLPARPVSSAHAKLVYDAEAQCYFLEDLDSLNGTEIDGTPVTGRVRLRSLHVITFAERFDFVFRAFEGDPQAAAGTARDEGTEIDREVPTLPLRMRDNELSETGDVGAGTRAEEFSVALPPSRSTPTSGISG